MSHASIASSSYTHGSRPEVQVSPMSQPTLLRTNSNHLANLVDVPVEPMVPANELNSERQVRLEILGDNILCLQPVPSRPPWLSRLTYFCFLGCLGFMIYCGVQGMVLGMERNKSITTIVWGCFAVIPALILLASLIYPFFKAGPLSYRFDRISRLMTVQRCYGFNKTPRLVATYGLQDAVALQLLYRYYKVHQAGIHTDDVKRPSYEMNLVFSNTVPPRVNLAVHPDWRWMQQAGARLAEFLELPVVDQLCKT